MKIGYARVSTKDQNLTIQRAALLEAGCEKIFEEKISGTRSDRPQLEAAIEFARDGDVIICTRLDRFARSTRDLHNMVGRLDDKNVGFTCTEQPFDTTTSLGRMVFGLLGVIAQFETELRAERVTEGVEAAKAQGKFKGRKATIDKKAVQRLLNDGHSPQDVAKMLKIARSSVYRVADVGAA